MSDMCPKCTATVGHDDECHVPCEEEADDLRAKRDELKTQLAALKADCARISTEMGLPPGMVPADGEFRRLVQTTRDLQTQLAAAQARETEVRRAGNAFKESFGEYVRQSMYFNPEWSSGLKAFDAALAAKPDHAALRAFGLKVARETRESIDPRSPDADVIALVDDVLKGGA